MSSLLPFLTTIGLGFLYFISAIPAAVVAGLPLWAATLLAWLGYTLGAIVILVMGTPFRTWLTQKWRLSFTPDSTKLFWRIWERYGAIGLGLIAPFTLGPQLSALLLLGMGVKPWKILFSLGAGAIPSALFLAVVVERGRHFLG